MAQISIPLIQGADSANNVGDAFDSRTAQFNQERMQKEKQQDADFHTVVKYASDGLTNEAKYFAQQKGINVPDEVFKNADFAKGLSIAGDLYDDPVAAQKFTTAYVSTGGDLMSRYSAGLGAGGKPMSKDDRDLALYAKKLQLQQQYGGGADKGYTLNEGQTRFENGRAVASVPKSSDDFDIWSKTYNASISSGLKTEEEARAAADAAVAQKKQMQPQNPNAGAGNPAVTTPYQNIQPVIMDGSGNMSATQQGQARLTPPPAPQAQQQTQLPVGLPAGSVRLGKANGGIAYKTPDGKILIDDGQDQDIQKGSVESSININDSQSMPSLTPVNQGANLNLTPVGNNQNQTADPLAYASVPPTQSIADYARTGLYNATNIPAHLDRIGRASVGLTSGILNGVQTAGQGTMQGIDNLIEGTGNIINKPSQVIVYDQKGNAFYVPVEQVEIAEQNGYSRYITNGPNVPISQ